ncbi:TIGR03943 family protein [filamentous cyanobacterium CCP2]|nr:TIGR03943 family protein [filamentous cyanobacterium CCP2]
MTTKPLRLTQSVSISDLLDTLLVALWGVLLFKYWLTGELRLLVHPRYFWIIISAGVFLLLVAGCKVAGFRRKHPIAKAQHFTYFPSNLSSGLLILVAILGLITSPQILNSQVAMQEGITDLSISTRVQTQAFHGSTRSEEKSLLDWAKTLAVYPEPSAYVGQKANVLGFVVHPSDLPEQYFIITRFVIGHCALDAYPVGLLVQLTQNRQAYSPDSWLEVEGQMITVDVKGKSQLAIEAKSLKPVPKPKDPYEY